MSDPNQKCHNCQSNLTRPCFINREKEYIVCPPCLEEMKRAIEKVVDLLNTKDLRKYFEHCVNYFDKKDKNKLKITDI